MASLLRSIVAGPRSRHPEAGLDLCYVTPQIIATSGPSGTYPQRAYRNPLDQLVKFLDTKHGAEWAIWEFRAEGTGYPDEEVYGRVWHYPWPDHHPPPFRLVPPIMAGMRNWLQGARPAGTEKERVVVVHCKAGKGRSGTISCSYLISECGWKAEDALARFTERRMRTGFGQGVSIPSQLRWVGYVDRWTRGGKVYIERRIEILEVHVWGLRNGVKVQVEGYVDEGKTIKLFHVFHSNERVVLEGNTPGGRGFTDMVSDMAGFQTPGRSKTTVISSSSKSTPSIQTQPKPPTTETAQAPTPLTPSSRTSSSAFYSADDNTASPGGSAVIFKPATPIILPTSDINIDFERRNRATMGGWTMVTSVAHVWFNAYFEGLGPEQQGKPNDNGVFEMEWEGMDGIKGSSRKGTKAFDRLAVVWRAAESETSKAEDYGAEVPVKGEEIHEPGLTSPVPQMRAADWRGENGAESSEGKDLGLRTESEGSRGVSRASSLRSVEGGGSNHHGHNPGAEKDLQHEGVKSGGPLGEDSLDVDGTKPAESKV